MIVKGKKFTIGADPEVFMGKNGKFVSAHDKIPGSKHQPFKVEQGAVQVDGMALEFNIDPASSFEEFSANLNTVQSILKGMIGDHDFLKQSSVFFDEEFTKDIPIQNLLLGCSADYDGWTMCEVRPPEVKTLMRTAGGHIHIGGFFTDEPFDPDHFYKCGRLARILDETLGVYSILWDKDDQRRSMYGKAGCFRPKTYGMEYRTLSNQWIFDSKLVKFVYDSVQEAIEKWLDDDYEEMEYARDIINNSLRTSGFFDGNEKAKLVM